MPPRETKGSFDNMKSNIKEQLEILVELQKIESETSIIKAIQIDTIKRLETLDNNLKEFELSLKDNESKLDELRKKYRDYESDSQVNLAREKTTREKLNSVKTNREYQSLLKEIEDAKAKNSNLEDEMIECLDLMDDIEKVIAAKEDEYAQLSISIDSEKEDIRQSAEKDKKKLLGLDADRKLVSNKIDPTLLEKYLILKERYQGGLAVVPVQDAICRGCNVNLPPQLYNELHRCDTLRFCPNCHRIIYWRKQQ